MLTTYYHKVVGVLMHAGLFSYRHLCIGYSFLDFNTIMSAFVLNADTNMTATVIMFYSSINTKLY